MALIAGLTCSARAIAVSSTSSTLTSRFAMSSAREVASCWRYSSNLMAVRSPLPTYGTTTAADQECPFNRAGAKFCALPKSGDRAIEAASPGVEMESKRSVTRSYPTGRRSREVSRNKHDGGIGEGLEETAPGCSRRLPIDTKTAVELWLRALQRRMHDVATQDHGGALALHHNTHVSGRVSWPRLNPDVVVEGIVRSDQLGSTTFHYRQQAVFIVGIGSVFGSQFSYPPVLPFLAGEEVPGIRERRRPSAVDEARVPTDVVGMEMRAQHIVDVFRSETGGGEVREIGPVFPIIAQLVRTLLVVA